MLIEEYYLDWEDDIEHHPGVKPLHSYLFVDDYFFCLKPQPGRRLGQAEVSWYFEEDKEKWRKKYGISLPLANPDARNKHDDFLAQRRNKVERLNNVLVSLSASVMDTRIPVVSVGSYAIPSRLKQLYESDNVSANSIIPVFRARLHGFNMVYANNITKKGAIRTVPVYSKNNTCIAHAQIMFMNIQQIALLQGNDPDYRLVEIDTSKGKFHGKRLEICDSEEILHHFYLYSCNDGPLTLPSNPSAWVMPPIEVIQVDEPQLPNAVPQTQSELLKELRPLWNAYMVPPRLFPFGYNKCWNNKSLRANLAAEKEVREAFKKFLEEKHTRESSDFLALKLPKPDLIPSVCKTYDQIPTTWKQPPTWGMSVKRSEGYVAGDFFIEVPQKGLEAYINRFLYPYVLVKHSSENSLYEYSPSSIIGKISASEPILQEVLKNLKSYIKRQLSLYVSLLDATSVEIRLLIVRDINTFIECFFYAHILLTHSWKEGWDDYFPLWIVGSQAAVPPKVSTHSEALLPSEEHKETDSFIKSYLYPHMLFAYMILIYSWGRRFEEYSPYPITEPEAVKVNMTLRTAIGLEIGEHLEYFTPNIPLGYRIREILQDIVIPRRYLITRLQRGEPAAIEIGACLLPAETLQMLGIEPADYVRLEGIPSEKSQWTIPTRRLRAYPIPVDVIEQRATLVKNIDDALFPDCSEKLGVFPDLDPIMLDEMARKELNLEICSPVRIRASRKHQASKETRNFLLAFFLAAIGAVGIFAPLWNDRTNNGSQSLALISFLDSIGILLSSQNPGLIPVLVSLTFLVGFLVAGILFIILGLRARLKP